MDAGAIGERAHGAVGDGEGIGGHVGRQPLALELAAARIARGSGVNVIAPSGLHHERYYHDRHWSVRLSADEIADLFVADIEEGIDGLIHVSDMSWTKRVKHPSDVLKKGDDIKARITNIDVENQRVSLSIKEFLPNKWDADGRRLGLLFSVLVVVM